MKAFYHLSIILGLLSRSPISAFAQSGTRWATIIGTDSYGADVYPEGYDGVVDPANAEQECKTWCLSVPTCTMFLWYEDDSGICYIKTGAPQNVAYQQLGPEAPYNLVIRNMDCATASGYIAPYVAPGTEPPQCIESTGNNEEEEDEVPRGALNEPCLEDGSCLNGNVCDSLQDGSSNICKAPLGGNCLSLTDCSNTIDDPRLECTLEGGTNDNRICAIPQVVEPEPPAPSQAAARKKRNAIKARMLEMRNDACPKKTIACLMPSGNNFECVNPNEELAHCGSCGNNCQALPGVHEMGVMCAQGSCLVYRCQKGYKLVDSTCLPKARKR